MIMDITINNQHYQFQREGWNMNYNYQPPYIPPPTALPVWVPCYTNPVDSCEYNNRGRSDKEVEIKVEDEAET